MKISQISFDEVKIMSKFRKKLDFFHPTPTYDLTATFFRFFVNILVIFAEISEEISEKKQQILKLGQITRIWLQNRVLRHK